MSLQSIANRVLVWLHGPRIGITGDGQASVSSALVLDGVPVATTRAEIVVCQLGRNGAGTLALAGAVVGDNVVNVTNISTPGDVTASFESTITVAGQIQQSAATNLSAAQLIFSVAPQS